MNTGINKSKTLTKNISCECKCIFDGKNVIQINGGITIKVDVCEKDYAWNPATSNCENGKYLASIMNDSAFIYDEVIKDDEEKRNFNEKKGACKTQHFRIVLAFLLITSTLLIANSSYCCLMKY